MVLTEKQEEQIRNMPIIEQKISKSKDGQYVIDKTVITWLKPIKYWEKVMENKEEKVEEVVE